MLETVTAHEAGNKIENLIDETAQSHRPILITAERQNAILLAEEDWNALQETIYLISIPQMRESIIEIKNAPDQEFLSENEFFNELEKDSGESD